MTSRRHDSSVQRTGPSGRAMRGRRRGAAFTLLELLIVIVILGAIAAVVVPRFAVSAAGAKRNACAYNVATINGQVERWYMEKGEWPAADLSDIGADTRCFPDGIPACPVSGSRYRLDATTYRVQDHPPHAQDGVDAIGSE